MKAKRAKPKSGKKKTPILKKAKSDPRNITSTKCKSCDEKEYQGEDLCGQMHEPSGYVCSRKAKHEGDHAACMPNNHEHTKWPKAKS